jgi:hypothetical protein
MNDDQHKEIDETVDKLTEGAESTEIVIPDTVKDPSSYKKYIKLKDAPALRYPQRLIETSDLNLTIDPVGHAGFIQKKIIHLPSDEQDAILQRVKGLKVIYLRIGALKLKAYGQKRPKHHTSLTMGLLDERASELIEYYGRMLDHKEVHKIVVTDWGYDVGVGSLRNFYKKYKVKIEDLIETFKRDFGDIRLTHKKGRLEELVNIYNARKIKWELSKSIKDEELMLKTLRAIRDEVEDKTLRIDHNINAKMEITINNHIQEEIMKSLTINDIIIARVASRMRINPRFLITRLHDSYYAKHSGFLRPDHSVQDEETQYPSQIVYNWNDIERQHKNEGDTGLELQKWEEVPQDKIIEGADLKSILKSKLLSKKDDLHNSKERIIKNTKKDS